MKIVKSFNEGVLSPTPLSAQDAAKYLDALSPPPVKAFAGTMLAPKLPALGAAFKHLGALDSAPRMSLAEIMPSPKLPALGAAFKHLGALDSAPRMSLAEIMPSPKLPALGAAFKHLGALDSAPGMSLAEIMPSPKLPALGAAFKHLGALDSAPRMSLAEIMPSPKLPALGAAFKHLGALNPTSIHSTTPVDVVLFGKREGDVLRQIERLLLSGDIDPAALAMVIGSVLERFLTARIKMLGLKSPRRGLTECVKILSSSGDISERDREELLSYTNPRNDSAHGRWEQVGDKAHIGKMFNTVIAFIKKHEYR